MVGQRYVCSYLDSKWESPDRTHSSDPSRLKHPKKNSFWLFGLLILLCFKWGCERSKNPTYSSHTQRIINGVQDFNQPGIGALVHQKGSPFCTATLIRPQLVLTAAHCLLIIQREGLSTIHFRVDTPDTHGSVYSEYTRLKRLIMHPKYIASGQAPAYDIALIVLAQPIHSVRHLQVSRFRMPSSWQGNQVKVVGYGYIQTTPAFLKDNKKYQASIPIHSIASSTFIHMDRSTQKSACHGDSGGPALYDIHGQEYIIGVTSVAYQATPSSRPGLSLCDGGAVSTRVDVHFNSFILPYLQHFSGKPQSCSQDNECLPCSRCTQNVCTNATQPSSATQCRPCMKNQDCGTGICHPFPSGSRCIFPCSGSQQQCCPTGYYCATPLINGALQHSFCMPKHDTCPPISCTHTDECGKGEHCQRGTCVPRPVEMSSQLCLPCMSSNECGPGGFCHNSSSGMGFCTQPCSLGNFCPSGFTCSQVSASMQQCIPKKGCFRTCSATQPCPTNWECKAQICIRKGGGQQGDFCDAKAPCSTQHTCLVDGTSSRCIRDCSPPKGSAGTTCNATQCKTGLKCLSFGTQLNVCLEECKTKCTYGGQCSNLIDDLSVCLCSSDQDCQPGQMCNQGQLGALGTFGACVPRPQGALACSPSSRCEALPSQGNYCRPQKGEQARGERCSFIRRCTSSLQCGTLGSQTDRFCLQTCASDSMCSQGRCLKDNGDVRYCLCEKSSDCSGDAYCQILDSSTHRGVCRTKPSKTCSKDQDCPHQFICLQGQCKWESSQANEPIDDEPISEHHTDGGAPELPSEQQSNQETQRPTDLSSNERTTREYSAKESVSTDKVQNIESPKDLNPPRTHCGCTQNPTHIPFSTLGLCLVFLALLRRSKV